MLFRHRLTNTAAKLACSNRNIEYACRRLRSLFYPKGMGKASRDFYEFLERTQFLSPAKLEQLQFERLSGMLRYAYDNSAFYRNLYDEHGVDVRSIRSFDDFRERIPLVNREMMTSAGNVTVFSRRMGIVTTSGTSGSPFRFYIDRQGFALERAAIFHQWARAGFCPGDMRIEMRGFQSAPIVRLPDERVVRFSTTNMDANMRGIVEFMNNSRIGFIHGYPSAIAKFALLLRDADLSLDYRIKGVFLASEVVYGWQVDIIDEIVKPETVIAHYGCAERIALGAWCESTRAYHFNPLYGYIEKGTLGNIIGTGFINRATPFIRYQMGDTILDWSDSTCADCKRGYTPVVRKIGGRLEDYLVDEKDELIPPAVVTFPFKELHVIESIQIHQTEDRNLVLSCVIRHGDDPRLEKEKEELSSAFRRLLGKSIRVSFREVDEIKLTDNFKFKWIISEARKPLISH